MKKTVLIFFLLLLFSIPSIKSLLSPGGYTSHDLTHHVIRQVDMDRLLSEGQFPPRWSGELNQGYGYPLFLFNYPTPQILGVVFHRIGFNFVESVKAVLLFSMVMSVIGMYLFLDSLFPKQKLASFLGAMFYLYAPVRFLNVYVSAAVGNALAMGIVPFIFWAIVKISQGKRWAAPVGSLLITLLITSHNVTALIFSPLLLAFSLFQINKSVKKLILFKNLALMSILGLGLAAFFWIPSIIEKKYIIYDQVAGTNWTNQFPTLWQLVRSPWGYGLSHPENPEPGDMSYQLGLAHLMAAIVLLVSVVIWRKKKKLITQGIFWLAVFSVSLFLILKISSPLWASLPFLYLVQFPLRFSAVAIFAAAVAAALLVMFLPLKKFVFILLLGLVLYANRNHLNVNQKFDPGDPYYMALKTTTTSFNEHLPIWAYAPNTPAPGKLSIIEGEGEITIKEAKSAEVSAEIDLTSPSKIIFNQFYFPGWELKINGDPIQFSYTEENENRGLPIFNLTKGGFSFEAKFTNTIDRKIADTISVISLVALGFLLILPRKKQIRR